MKYKLKDGTVVPMFEADYDLAFEVFKKDCRKAKIGNPTECIEAKGLCRLRNVAEGYVGSGRDAYVIFKKTITRDYPHALHFIIAAESEKVRDIFEVSGGTDRQTLWLRAPTQSKTVSSRRAYNNKHHAIRRAAEKAGNPIPKKRQKKNIMRMDRIGVAPRPRAKIIKGGVVTLFDDVSPVETTI